MTRHFHKTIISKKARSTVKLILIMHLTNLKKIHSNNNLPCLLFLFLFLFHLVTHNLLITSPHPNTPS